MATGKVCPTDSDYGNKKKGGFLTIFDFFHQTS
jgi:hypothetical protein